MDDEVVYVQYGCWKDSPEGWLNFDCSPYLRIDRIPLLGSRILSALRSDWTPFPDSIRYGDIVKGLPIREESCKAVYCSHILEHLSLTDFRAALANTARLLKPGGTFRMVLPDLAHYIGQYHKDSATDAAMSFMLNTGLGEPVRARGLKGMAKEVLGNSRHRWMWDFPSLERELHEAGFRNIRRAVFGDSSDDMFSRVEKQERWRDCLGVECKKRSLSQ